MLYEVWGLFGGRIQTIANRTLCHNRAMTRFDMIRLAGRLLQQAEAPPAPEGPAADPGTEEEPTAYTLDLRITAIFVVLASGLLGGLLPLVIKVGALSVCVGRLWRRFNSCDSN